MTTLLVLRERIKKYYARYGGYIIRLLRFLLAFAVFMTVNAEVGYMERLNHVWLCAALAAIFAFLPNSALTVGSAVFVLIHMYAVSLEVFFVVFAVLLVFFSVYYIFQPGDSIILLLFPLMFVFRIPLIVPLALGLLGTAFSVIPMSFGVMIYYILRFIRDNAGVLSSSGTLSMPGRYTQMINGFLGNKEMWVVLFACCVTLLTVYVIRRLSVNHAWKIAIACGMVVNIVLLFVGVFVADISLPVLIVILDAVLAAVVGLILEFFLFHLDYSRTEHVQFEDDDYYYYVKAVPKIAVTQPEVTVTKINTKKSESSGRKEDPETGAGGEELFNLQNTQVLSDRTQPLEKVETDYDETV